MNMLVYVYEVLQLNISNYYHDRFLGGDIS
jgi:hypothetical protein